MSRFTLIKTPDEYDLAIAEREAQTDAIDAIDAIDAATALIEARIQVIDFRQNHPEAA